MIGNKNKKGAVGILILIVFIIVALVASFWIIEEAKYSWKNKKIINEHNATCYLERGLFKFPLATICSYEDTVILEKTQFGNNFKSKMTSIPAKTIKLFEGDD
tara:strand:+ start:1974 stop:2282 length:309 start_codon:yes stop_codon:yes gene_type:complete